MAIQYKIVITGAPGSGKTKFLNKLQEEIYFKDFIFFNEMARQLLDQKPSYRDNWHEFHLQIYHNQTKRENDTLGRSFITDRGTIDAAAFHPEILDVLSTTLENEYRRYNYVFQLGTSAALGKEYYSTDDVRIESIEKALEIERALKKVWGRHSGYKFISACEDMSKKYENLLCLLRKITGR